MIKKKSSTISSRISFLLTGGYFIAIYLFFPALLTAQNQVQIIRADSIVGGRIQGTPIQKILGDVHLRSKNMDMYADSAYKFSSQEKVQAFGNIEIDTEKETIWTDTLTYFTDIDFSKLRGRVVIESDSSTLFGNSVDYRFTNKVAHFLDYIRLEDQQGTLIANSGFYFRQKDSASFHGNVQLRDSLKYIEGDQMFTNRHKKYYELHGNVFADNPENESMLKGDYLEADSTGRRLVKGHAWLENYKSDSTTIDSVQTDSLRAEPADTLAPHSIHNDSLRSSPPDSASPPDSLAPPPGKKASNSQPDTTHIHAKRILSLQNRTPDDTTTTVKAYENVRIWSTNFSSISDSAEYQSKEKTFELWGNAKAWHEQIQLTGPYIWVKLQDGDIKRLVSHPDPFTVQQDTVIDRLNQIKGDTLDASFQQGQLRLIRVFQNSHLLRFTQKNNNPDGVLELHAPVTNIYFENGKLVQLKSFGKQELVNGDYLPESKEIAEKKLEGFTWNPDQRPKKPPEKMEARFPPIPKNPPFKLPRRYLEHIGRPDSLQPMLPDSLQKPIDHLQTPVKDQL